MPGALIGFIFASPILMASLGLSGAMASGAKLQAGFPYQGNIPGQATIAGGIGPSAPFTVDFTSISALPSQISFSRASNAMMYDSTGKLTYAPNNLFFPSDDLTSTNWAKVGTAAAPNANTLNLPASGDRVQAFISSSGVAGKNVIFSAVLSGSGTVTLGIYDGVFLPGDQVLVTLTATPTRYYFRANIAPSDTDVRLWLGRIDGTETATSVTVSGVTLSAVTYETTPRAADQVATTSAAYFGPRFDHDPATLAAKGLLAEEQRTNLILQSNNFADTGSPLWAYQTATGVQNVTGPDGVSNGAWTVTASSTFAQFYQPISLSAGSAYSVYVKKGTSPYVYIQTNFSTGGLVKLTYFDPATGAVVNANVTDTGSGSGVQTAITSTPVGNGWYRIGVVNTGDSTAYVAFGLAATSSSHATTIGHTAFFFGAQVEAATFATSYIPTTSAAVTRSADFNSIAGADFTSVYNQSANTFVLEYQGEETPDPFGDIFSINNGSFQETNTIYADLAIFFRAGNVNQLTPGPALSTPLSLGSPHRVAVAASVAGGYAICCDGATDNTGFNTATVGAMPTPDRIEFGGFTRVSGNKPSGWYRSLSIYKSRLTNAQIQALTSFDPVFTTDFTSISALPSQISFSRASNATMYDDNGMLTYAPNNIIPYSQDFSNGWSGSSFTTSFGVTDPLGGSTAARLTATSANADFFRTAFAASYMSIGSLWIRRVSGTGDIQLVTPGNSRVTMAVTSTWTRFGVRESAGGFGGYCGVRVVTSGDVVEIAFAQLEAVTYETSPRTYNPTTSSAYYGPRFDYDPFTCAAKGLLIEEQRTNLLTYSNDFTNVIWTDDNASITAAATVGPDGVTGSASKLVENGSNFHHAVYEGFSSAAPYTGSVYAKAAGRHFLSLSVGIQRRACFDLSNGTVTQVEASNVVATISPVGNGWYRCAVSVASGTADYFVISASDTGTPSWEDYGRANYQGDSSSGLYLFGSQVEAGAFPTSYIPTTSAAVTRSEDRPRIVGTALTALATAATAGAIIAEVGEAQTSNAIYVVCPIAATNIRAVPDLKSTGTYGFYNGTVDRNSADTVGVSSVNRIAATWDGSSAHYAANGGTVQDALTTAGVGGTPDDGYIGTNGNGGGYLNGHFRSFTIYNVRLPDSRLQSVSALSLTDGVATLPVVTPNVSVPIINGSTFNVTAGSASSLDAQLFAAAGADGNLNHEVVIPIGTPIDGNFTLYNKYGANPRGKGWILVRSNGTLPAPGVRALPTDASQMAKITCTPTGSGQRIFATESSAHHYYLCGLEITPNQGSIKLSGLINLGTPAVDQSFIEPHHIVIDRSYIHGLTTGNCTRIGISLQSRYTAIINNTIGPFVDTDPTVEAKSMYAVNGTGGYLISNNDIYASGQSFLVGGGDPLTAGKNPSDITITRNKFRKDPAWYGAGYAVKNHVEFKIGKRVLIEGNKFQYNWSEPVGGNTQNGQALSIQTKNQDGTASWNETGNICVRYNDFQDVCQLVSLSARSPTNYGVALHNVEFHDNRAYNIGLFSGHSGAGFAGIVVTAGPSNADSINSLAFRRNTILINDPSVFSFNMDNSSQPSTGQNTNFIFDDNIFTIATLGFKDTSASEGSPSIARFWTTTDVRGNVWIGSLHGATYPASNTTAANEAAMNFNADKSLGVGSPGLTSSISGGLSGANIAGVGGVNDKVLGV